ncbi:hypothetical protein BASA81_006142 [Batrachochytrium salamandrivorans]|nr:hypothetical protein BASA81_006142 [Batrachochytrium salamandrivorans]
MSSRKRLKRVIPLAGEDGNEDSNDQAQSTTTTTTPKSREAIRRDEEEAQKARLEAKLLAISSGGKQQQKKKPSDAGVSKRPIRNSLLASAAPTTATTPAAPTTTAASTPPGPTTPIHFSDLHTVVRPAPAPAHNLSRNFDSFVLDCDGVLWHDQLAIAGSARALQELRARGSKVHFMTNNSTLSRASLAAKITSLLGFSVDAQVEVTTSGSACAALIRHHVPHATRAFVIGEQGLVDELALMQIQAVTDSGPVDVVVCGLDSGFTYAKLRCASNYVQQCGVLFATNMDAYDVAQDGRGTVPGAGCLVNALLTSLSSPPVNHIVCGKPNPQVLQHIMHTRGMEMGTTVVVGDRLDTDIAWANQAGVTSCLVLSGVAREFSTSAKFVKRSLEDFVLN